MILKNNKVLLIMVGAPGVGKSTWISDNKLDDVSLSTDNFRLLVGTKILDENGDYMISQKYNQETFDLFFTALESRMSNGLFTVLDATHLTKKSYGKYITLANKYGYKIFYKELTANLDDLIERNKYRGAKNVSEDIVTNMFEKQENLKIPNQIKKIKTVKDLPNFIPEKFENLEDKYNDIYYIGDIQGCSKELEEFINKYYSKNSLFVFTGDLIDRGYDNGKVLELILSIIENDNVIIVRGNHDTYLERYVTDGYPIHKKEFDTNTYPQIKHIEVEKLKKITNKIVDAHMVNVGGKNIFTCHGGVSRLDNFIDTKTLEKGTGHYDDHSISDKSFEDWSINNTGKYYLVHGHRNSHIDGTQVNSRVFNLEGQVEFGGELRILHVSKKGETKTLYIESTFNPNENNMTNLKELFSNNRDIKVSKLEDGLYSARFTKKAFYKKNWNRIVNRARGIFFGENDEIYARSYDKFFNVGEMPETQEDKLYKNIGFPVNVYFKYNGFLGITGYFNDKVLYCSKSTNKGWFAEEVKRQLEPYEDKIEEIVKDGWSLVWEICSSEDPHIVKEKERPVLLECIKNSPVYEHKSYEELKEIAKYIGVEVKEKVTVLHNEEELRKFLDEAEDVSHEGFILVGENIMTKTKSNHYLYWKEVRSDINKLKRYIKIGQEYSMDNFLHPEIITYIIDDNIDYNNLSIIEIKEILTNNYIIGETRKIIYNND